MATLASIAAVLGILATIIGVLLLWDYPRDDKRFLWWGLGLIMVGLVFMKAAEQLVNRI